MARILILGATGNIASIVTSLLAKEPGHVLRLSSTRDEGLEQLKAAYPDAELAKADWHIPATLDAAFAGVDRVLMITPDFITDEVPATTNVVEAAKKANVGHIVRHIAIYPGVTDADITDEWFASRTGSALKNVTLPIHRNSGIPTTLINVAAWIGFNLMWFGGDDIKTKREMPLPLELDADRTWITEQDIAAVAAKVISEGPADHAGTEYVLTGPEKKRFKALADWLSDEVGEPVKLRDSYEGLNRAAGPNADRLISYIKCERHHCGNVEPNDTFEKLMGRKLMPMSEYVKEMREYFY
jgi:NAD(P)H dehydrogenase (quinone)